MKLTCLIAIAVSATSVDAAERADPVAIVFGEEVSLKALIPAADIAEQKAKRPASEFAAWLEKTQCSAIRGKVWGAVFDDFIKKNSLEPAPKEVEACAKSLREMVSKDWDPKDGPVPMNLEFAGGIVRDWKRDVALHRKYGGRVIFQQFGPEPIDAWRKVLEEYEAKKAFVVTDARLKTCVYDYFSFKFYDVGENETKQFLSQPMCDF